MELRAPTFSPGALLKAETGIVGFDEITFGGLPAGRPTLVCGSAGSGKTLFATTFLVNGAERFGEPGVFMSFEERPEDLAANVASLGFDLEGLRAENKIAIDYVRVERGEIEEAGTFDLDGLFIRLGYAVDAVSAKRVVLDTLEVLFAGFSDQAVIRSELRRLFQWIKDRGLTAVITCERGDGQLTRQGLEEYVSDCVLLLDDRVEEQISTRRLRVIKYRGSAHGTNEYPFLIDDHGISMLPVTRTALVHSVSSDVVASGLPALDAMLGRGGVFRGSSMLISGLGGAGKTSFSVVFANAACSRGERCLFAAFEESPAQICRNALSLGVDLQQHMGSGHLRFEAAPPSLYGLETHIARIHRELDEFHPDLVVVDPISALSGPSVEVHSTLLRIVDMLKSRCITAVFTSLQDEHGQLDVLNQGLSSLMDTWIRLVGVEANGELARELYVVKARGMSHSNQVREYRITDDGIVLIEPYIGPAGVLTGAARRTQIAQDQATELRREQDAQRQTRVLHDRREVMERQIAEMRAAADAEEEDLRILLHEATARGTVVQDDRAEDVARRASST